MKNRLKKILFFNNPHMWCFINIFFLLFYYNFSPNRNKNDFEEKKYNKLKQR